MNKVFSISRRENIYIAIQQAFFFQKSEALFVQSRTHKWRQLKQSPSIISIISRRIWTIGQGLLDLVSLMTMVGLFLLPFSHALHRCWGGRDDFNTTSRNRVDHGKRNSISNKTIHYFLYYINTIALYLQEKSTLLMKEKNGIHPRKILELPFSIRLEKKKCVESLQKQTIGKIFSYWLFPTKRISFFRYTAKIDLLQIFQLSVFVFRREKCH